MQTTENVEVVYRNDQWMVETQGDDVYLGTTGDGYYIDARRLATAAEDGYTELHHIAGKSWVDMDLLEAAARRAIELSGVTPNYDLAEAFADARRFRAASRGGR